MRDRLLTSAEKRAIRTMLCGKCGATPPYEDGSWTQKHRLVPESKGGRYTLKNTVPRCPECHSKEPGHSRQFTVGGRAAGLKGGPKGGIRVHELHPDMASQNMRRAWELHPDLMKETARKAAGRAHELHPDMARANGLKTGPMNGRKALHLRHHVKRNIVKPGCPHCSAVKERSA